MKSELKRDGRQIPCPFCNSTETEMLALFGQFLLASQYYCRNCHTVFDVVRWEEEPPSRPPALARGSPVAKDAHDSEGG